VDRFRKRLSVAETHRHPTAEVCSACLSTLTAAIELYCEESVGHANTFSRLDVQLIKTESFALGTQPRALGCTTHVLPTERFQSKRYVLCDTLKDENSAVDLHFTRNLRFKPKSTIFHIAD
jgi:hypothetical protein